MRCEDKNGLKTEWKRPKRGWENSIKINIREVEMGVPMLQR
jgi:hypothetical protein